MRSGKEQERRKTSINLPLADSLPPVLRILTWPDFPGGSALKKLPAMQEIQVGFLGQEDPLEKKTATHSSILAWKTPRTEEPGGLQSMGSQKNWTQLNNKH